MLNQILLNSPNLNDVTYIQLLLLFPRHLQLSVDEYKEQNISLSQYVKQELILEGI